MESFKESLMLEASEEELQQNPSGIFKLDPDICSWNSKKYPSVKTPDQVRVGISNRKYLDSHRKTRKKSEIQDLKKKILKSDLNNIILLNSTPGSPSPESNSFKSRLCLSMKNSKMLQSKKPNVISFAEYSNQIIEKPKYFNYFNMPKQLTQKRSKGRSVKSVNKERPYTRNPLFDFQQKIPEKFNEIITVARTQSPPPYKHPQRLREKLPIYMAKTLEELLTNSKLPEIASKKSRLRGTFYNF